MLSEVLQCISTTPSESLWTLRLSRQHMPFGTIHVISGFETPDKLYFELSIMYFTGKMLMKVLLLPSATQLPENVVLIKLQRGAHHTIHATHLLRSSRPENSHRTFIIYILI